MNTRSAFFQVAAFALACVVHDVGAFETPTHWRLSVASFKVSNLATSELQRQLGISAIIELELFRAKQKKSDDDFDQVTPSCDPKAPTTLPRLISCGAMYEDVPGVRSFNHFFNPKNGEPLTVGGQHPGTVFGKPNLPSPDWALQDNNSIEAQQFSYSRARQYFHDALTLPGDANADEGRNDHWALLFQSLGQVIHHVQDMAQPQHVRNDPHADWALWFFGSAGFGELRHPSRFEKYSRTAPGLRKIEKSLAQGVVPVYPAYAQYFNTPRAFWTGSDRGLADYTNRNFVSYGTNFYEDVAGNVHNNPNFASPVPGPPKAWTITEAFGEDPVPAAILAWCVKIGIQNCLMTFYPNQWTDPLTNASIVNARASTQSIFDEDLGGLLITFTTPSGSVTTSKILTLHQLNFDAVYPHLIPRAVAYSAGLINFFFRGKMEISLPADGLYALVDHHAQRCKDACGFGKVKLKLKNTTPNEDMRAGSLVAVAKFHRNTCYRDDLSGEPGGPAFGGLACRSPQEEVVVSASLPLASLSTLEERELTFTFPERIPINASDLYLQVVFRGTLGAEEDAVVVTTKDIAEPNYFAFTNVTDAIYDFADHTYHAIPYNGFTESDPVYGLSVKFKTGASPLANLNQLNPASHAQLAYLTDPGTQFIEYKYSSVRYTVGGPARGDIPVSEFVSPPGTSIYGRSVEFSLSRGMYRDYYGYHRLPADWTIYSCSVEVELCAQTTLSRFAPATAVEWTINF